jgi:hypothetical protein
MRLYHDSVRWETDQGGEILLLPQLTDCLLLFKLGNNKPR